VEQDTKAEKQRYPKDAAVKVCILLEDLLDLQGNGWFDDDTELEAVLNEG
jgi:hypothetical protein